MNLVSINVAPLTQVFLVEQVISTVNVLIDGGVRMASYMMGAVVRLTATFKQGDILIDPAQVVVKIKDPNNNRQSYLYGSGVEVKRDNVGIYHFDLSLPKAGRWFYRFESSGNGQAAGEGSVEVAPSDF